MSDFIEKIEFNKDFPPFKGWDKFFLDGEKQVQDLVKFYLKSQWKDESFADRIKINCVLGNNGGGKTTLLKWIFRWDIKTNQSNKLLDTFANLDTLIEDSVNNKLIKERNYNEFYCDAYSFLQDEKNKKIYSSFLNIEDDYKNKLLLKFNNGWFYKIWWIDWNPVLFLSYNNSWTEDKNFVNWELYNDYEKIHYLFKFLFYHIEKDIEKKNFLQKLFWLADVFIWYINESSNNINWKPYDQGSYSSFINDDNYWKFKVALDFLLKFLSYIEKEEILSGFLKTEQKIDCYKFWDKNYQNYIIDNFSQDFENIKENTKLILGIFEKLETNKKLENDEKKILRKISWYEKNYESASEFLILELILNFNYEYEVNDDKRLKNKYSLTVMVFKIFILYFFRNDYLKSFDNKYINYKNINFDFLKKGSYYPILNLDLQFSDSKTTKSFNNLSAWEKMMLSRFTNIYMKISEEFENWKKDFTILIDEPDLHLHLEWQKKYIQKLIDVFSTLPEDIKVHFIIATHSPFIISDLPNEAIVVLDGSEKNKYNWEFTEIKRYENKTFGANFVDLIRDGFFFEDEVLMGSFAEENIKDFSIAYKFLLLWIDKINRDNLDEKEKQILEFLENENIENLKDFKEKYIDLIWDDFLKNNLAYL